MHFTPGILSQKLQQLKVVGPDLTDRCVSKVQSVRLAHDAYLLFIFGARVFYLANIANSKGIVRLHFAAMRHCRRAPGETCSDIACEKFQPRGREIFFIRP